MISFLKGQGSSCIYMASPGATAAAMARSKKPKHMQGTSSTTQARTQLRQLVQLHNRGQGHLALLHLDVEDDALSLQHRPFAPHIGGVLALHDQKRGAFRSCAVTAVGNLQAAKPQMCCQSCCGSGMQMRTQEPEKPPSRRSEAMTRWHGTMGANGFRRMPCIQARVGLLPVCCAMHAKWCVAMSATQLRLPGPQRGQSYSAPWPACHRW